MRSRRRSVALALAAAVAAAGCGSPAKTVHAALDPTALLARSRAVLDASPAVHFSLTSAGVATGSTSLTGGSGDLARPDQLRGSFEVSISGFTATVAVIETGGRFWAEPPFQSHYSLTNPATYGLGDPAQLLSPTRGVSALLTEMTAVHRLADERLDGERLEVLTGSVPGRSVPVLPDAAPAQPVRITAAIDPGSAQLRQVVLVGPFSSATRPTSYTVTITDYGHPVTITPPTG